MGKVEREKGIERDVREQSGRVRNLKDHALLSFFSSREKFMSLYERDSSNGRAPLHCGGVDSISTLFFIFIFGG